MSLVVVAVVAPIDKFVGAMMMTLFGRAERRDISKDIVKVSQLGKEKGRYELLWWRSMMFGRTNSTKQDNVDDFCEHSDEEDGKKTQDVFVGWC